MRIINLSENVFTELLKFAVKDPNNSETRNFEENHKNGKIAVEIVSSNGTYYFVRHHPITTQRTYCFKQISSFLIKYK